MSMVRSRLLLLAFAVAAAWWTADTAWSHLRHYPAEYWQSDLWADAAGYHVYLPGLFHHGMRARGWQAGADSLHGLGFRLDFERDRVLTKYTCGVAMLQLPAYLFAEWTTDGVYPDGFADEHRRAMEIGGAVYWSAGMLLLAIGLVKRWGGVWWHAALVVALVGFGSNAAYYAVRQPGASHVYSFFLVSTSIGVLLTGLENSAWKRRVFHLACALLILIRPVDALAVAALWAWLWLDRDPLLRKASFWIGQLIALAIVSVPQLLYWRFAYDDWVVYSYGDEGFTNWAAPEVSKFLFSPGNGWLPYTPVLVPAVLGFFAMSRTDGRHGALIALLLCSAVIISASWHMWNYGCAFGARPMAQYMPFLAIPLHALIRSNEQWLRRARALLVPITVVATVLLMRIALDYDVCYGDELDDWGVYISMVRKAMPW